MTNDLVLVDGVRLTRAELADLVDAEAQALLDEGWRPYDVCTAPGNDFAEIIRACAALAIGLQLRFDKQERVPTSSGFPITLGEAYQAHGGIEGCPPYLGWFGDELFANRLPATAWLRLIRRLGEVPRGQERVIAEWCSGSPPLQGVPGAIGDDLVYDPPVRIGDEVLFDADPKARCWPQVGFFHQTALRPVRCRIRQLYDVDVDDKQNPRRWRPISFWPHAEALGRIFAEVEVIERASH